MDRLRFVGLGLRRIPARARKITFHRHVGHELRRRAGFVQSHADPLFRPRRASCAACRALQHRRRGTDHDREHRHRDRRRAFPRHAFARARDSARARHRDVGRRRVGALAGNLARASRRSRGHHHHHDESHRRRLRRLASRDRICRARNRTNAAHRTRRRHRASRKTFLCIHRKRSQLGHRHRDRRRISARALGAHVAHRHRARSHRSKRTSVRCRENPCKTSHRAGHGDLGRGRRSRGERHGARLQRLLRARNRRGRGLHRHRRRAARSRKRSRFDPRGVAVRNACARWARAQCARAERDDGSVASGGDRRRRARRCTRTKCDSARRSEDAAIELRNPVRI